MTARGLLSDLKHDTLSDWPSDRVRGCLSDPGSLHIFCLVICQIAAAFLLPAAMAMSRLQRLCRVCFFLGVSDDLKSFIIIRITFATQHSDVLGSRRRAICGQGVLASLVAGTCLAAGVGKRWSDRVVELLWAAGED